MNDEYRLEEYRSLLEEHKKNRSYIFERPVIVLGLVSAAMYYFYGKNVGEYILAILIFVLLFNLWFTVNRLQSSARIVAYIQLVHEGEFRDKWIGWENCLRNYRIWFKYHRQIGDLEEICNEEVNKDAIPDSILFYPAIWLFHNLLVIFILIITIVKYISSRNIIPGPDDLGIVFASLIFFIYTLGNLYPKKLNPIIELQRAAWICVFKETNK